MNEQLIKQFKEKLQQRIVLGSFMKSCDPAFIEVAGYAHLDFVILDMEHGPISFEKMQNCVRAAQVAEILPIIRVKALNEHEISKALDIGVAGVEIPQITDAKEAEDAVKAARFYPSGERGVCRFVRAANYSSTPKDTYFKNANQTLIIIQLEGSEALDNIDKILEVKGIDIIFIGPYDLSQSLGLPGETTHPKVVAQMQEIVKKAKEKDISVGTFTDSPETMKFWMDAGVKYIAHSVDVGIFYEALAGLVEQFRIFL